VQDCSISSAASAEAYVLKFGRVRYAAFYASVEMTSSITRGKWHPRPSRKTSCELSKQIQSAALRKTYVHVYVDIYIYVQTISYIVV